VFCIGRNYADHVAEMGGHADRNPPVFFTKPADAVRCEPGEIQYPLGTTDLHHEVEWVVALYHGGVNLAPVAAGALVGASAVGIDLTRRDLQAAAKKGGGPWDSAKAFDDSAPLSALAPGGLESVASNRVMTLAVNGQERQRTTLDRLIWSVPELLSHLSALFELKPGDLVFTGTPAGVGALVPGDRVEAAIDGIAELSFRITPRAG
jgi:fumarylpyruvate hydrolase